MLYPRGVVARGYTNISFGENEIFASLISLLLLPTAHPLGLQPKWVRTSTDFYIRFALAMGSSPAFASVPCDRGAQLALAFAMAPPLRGLTKPHSTTRRLINQKARRRTGQPSVPCGTARVQRFDPKASTLTPWTGVHGAPTACRRTVSGSISPTASSLAFHLSLALLLRYRSPRST